MNSKIYRCGWCGMPTDSNGRILYGDAFQKEVRIIERYGDSRTHLVNGECCGGVVPNNERITKDMAIDAGDRSLEGQLLNP